MSIVVSNLCKHGNIDDYILKNHNDPSGFTCYRNQFNSDARQCINNRGIMFLLLETVTKCNLKCPMCVHSTGYGQLPNMPDELFDKIIEEIKINKIPSVCMNQINEPLLDHKIFDRISMVHDTGVVKDIFMNTNAVKLNSRNAQKLLETPLTRLLIGFDGFSKKTYETIRQGSDYEKTISNILNFLEQKEKLGRIFPVVRMSFVRTALNEHEVDDWVKFWFDKVDYLSIQEYLSPVSDDSKNHLIPKDGLRKKYLKEDIFCEQPFERLTVRANGDVIPCCSHVMSESSQGVIGNLYSESLYDIWNGSKINSLRNTFLNGSWDRHPICKRCLEISYGIEDKN